MERRNQFSDVVQQIQKIRSEIYASNKIHHTSPVVDETDLSLRKLEELQKELQALQREKVAYKQPLSSKYSVARHYCILSYLLM